MKAKKLWLPFGDFRVLVNQEPVEFDYEEVRQLPEQGTNAVIVTVNPTAYGEGDEVYFHVSAGGLACDGGGEYMLNAVAELASHTYAIGGIDTVHTEWTIGHVPGSLAEAYRREVYTAHSLPYIAMEMTEYGLRYRLVRNDAAQQENTLLHCILAWAENSCPSAREMVSAVTSDSHRLLFP